MNWASLTILAFGYAWPFGGLENGQSPIDVMRRYQVAIVSHGKPDREEIEAFRRQFVMGLGYCPETLA